MVKKAITNNSKAKEKKKLEEEILKEQVEQAVEEQKPIELETEDNILAVIEEAGYKLVKPFKIVELGSVLHTLRNSDLDDRVYTRLIHKFNEHFTPKLDIENDLEAPAIAYDSLILMVRVSQLRIEKNKKK